MAVKFVLGRMLFLNACTKFVHVPVPFKELEAIKSQVHISAVFRMRRGASVPMFPFHEVRFDSKQFDMHV